MPRARVLYGGDPRLVSDFTACLADEAELVAERDGGAFLAKLESDDWAVVLAERAHGGDEALELERARTARGELPPRALILLDAFGTPAQSLELVRAGAVDVIDLPASAETLAIAVRRALAARAAAAENEDLRARLRGGFTLGELFSADARVRSVFDVVLAVADAAVPILIEGESGTGKTALARAVHARSARASGPFVEVNCGALPSALLESELFGHAQGAFTGAHRDRAGKIESAGGGTLFLDEIASSSPDMQVKLLRVLESHQFERLGETRARRADFRLIAASNRALADEVAAGRFREDLYWRIRVVAVTLPPLRERPGDLALLAERLLERLCLRHGRPARSLAPRALAALVAHAWPGNVRELEHRLERALLLAAGREIEPADLELSAQPPALVPSAGSIVSGAEAAGAALGPLKQALAEPEKLLLERALRSCGGSRERAAELLGIHRSTLFHKIKRHGIAVPSSRARGR